MSSIAFKIKKLTPAKEWAWCLNYLLKIANTNYIRNSIVKIVFFLYLPSCNIYVVKPRESFFCICFCFFFHFGSLAFFCMNTRNKNIVKFLIQLPAILVLSLGVWFVSAFILYELIVENILIGFISLVLLVFVEDVNAYDLASNIFAPILKLIFYPSWLFFLFWFFMIKGYRKSFINRVKSWIGI